ncbi:MAG: transporter substrate-binding domain-containing protein [Synergistaceae bacterium]|nr:transporter substrate-binding domain-containing protein [Synergistaceae bacterium]
MKKAIVLVVLVGLIFYFVDMQFSEKRVLRIGVECDYVPNSWLEHEQTDSNLPISNDPEHFAEGYDIQIAKLVAAELGAKLEVRKILWDNLLDELNDGTIDAIFSGMLDTEPRKERAAFSETYDSVDNIFVILLKKGSSYLSARSISDFSGAKIVGQSGTILDDLIAQMPDVVHLNPADSVTAMVNMVIDGHADGAVINLDTAEAYQRKFDDLRLIRFSESDGFSVNFTGTCAAVRKRDTKLLYDINKAIHGISKWDRQRVMDRTIARAWRHLPEN